MRVIAIINLKGGVAKTTSAVNMSAILAGKGYKVLLVDNDKQGDASRWVGRRSSDRPGIDRIMVDKHPDMQALIQKTDFEGLDVITANLELLRANEAASIDQTRPQGNRIARALMSVQTDYDFCIIDNAPDINISTINAVAASDDVLIPVEIDGNTIEGLGLLLGKIQEISDGWNPELDNIRVFLTKMDPKRKIHREGLEEIFGKLLDEEASLMNTAIRFSEPISASSKEHLPTVLYRSRCNATADYVCLVNEYLDMVGMPQEVNGFQRISRR